MKRNTKGGPIECRDKTGHVYKGVGVRLHQEFELEILDLNVRLHVRLCMHAVVRVGVRSNFVSEYVSDLWL